MGYHNKEIKRGVHGEPSKIQEELDELNDALEQDNVIMALLELSDLYLAIEAVAIKLGSNIKNIETMALATKRAFESGERKSQDDGFIMDNDGFLHIKSEYKKDELIREKYRKQLIQKHYWLFDHGGTKWKNYTCKMCNCLRNISIDQKNIENISYCVVNSKKWIDEEPPCQIIKQ